MQISETAFSSNWLLWQLSASARAENVFFTGKYAFGLSV
jgi:hypothetical protein